ncbi:MAG: dihydroorotase [Acidobacteria bacterium]|nr:dihydroorotase [Acidobacteriota bacterium]
MRLLLKGGHLVDPARGVDGRRDLLIENGRILGVEDTLVDREAQVVDCSGLIVAPGFIDMHVHLREPGREDSETIETGRQAAAAGGFTSIACMPNTHPPNDNASVTEYIRRQAARSPGPNVFPIGCVSRGRAGEELAEIGDMVRSGVVAVSDDGDPVASARLLRQALEYSRMFDLPVIDHCEERELAGTGVMNEGFTATRLGLQGMPAAAEEVQVYRDAALARYVGGRVHIAHVSAGGSLAAIRAARREGCRITCEVAPHHFTLTEEAVEGFDPNTKMKPPLRSEADRQAILEGLRDGTVDVIASDHAPHNRLDKEVEFDAAAFGVAGLETAVSLALDRLLAPRIVDLERLVRLFSPNPARILNLAKGRLAPGDDADVTVLDLRREIEVSADRFRSKGRNSPFLGWKLRGAPAMTIVGGRIVHDAR